MDDWKSGRKVCALKGDGVVGGRKVQGEGWRDQVWAAVQGERLGGLLSRIGRETQGVTREGRSWRGSDESAGSNSAEVRTRRVWRLRSVLRHLFPASPTVASFESLTQDTFLH